MEHTPLPGRPRGQIIVTFALMVTALLALVGLGVDGANAFAHKRAVQSAADLAAMAAAGDLPNSATARDAAFLWAERNGYQHLVNRATVTVTTPYAYNTHKLEVKIKEEVPSFFLRVLGYQWIDVEGRAVAGRTAAGSADYTIYAYHSDCNDDRSHKSIEWSGSTNSVTGGVHSNSGILVNGSNNEVHGKTTYKSEESWCGEVHHPSTVFDIPPAVAGWRPWPITYTIANFICTPAFTFIGDRDLGQDGPWWVGGTKSSGQLLDGVYCATGTLSLSPQAVSGTVTFIADKIVIGGSNFNLTAHSHEVLLFATGVTPITQPFVPAISVSGSHGAWTGALYAPNGQVEISGGSSVTLWGRLVGQTVKMNGSLWNITGPASSPGAVLGRARLLE